jgi:hypothetical protein
LKKDDNLFLSANFKLSTLLFVIVFRAVSRFVRLLLFVKGLSRKNISIAELFEQQCEKSPNKACLVFEGREWTFKEVCCIHVV